MFSNMIQQKIVWPTWDVYKGEKQLNWECFLARVVGETDGFVDVSNITLPRFYFEHVLDISMKRQSGDNLTHVTSFWKASLSSRTVAKIISGIKSRSSHRSRPPALSLWKMIPSQCIRFWFWYAQYLWM